MNNLEKYAQIAQISSSNITSNPSIQFEILLHFPKGDESMFPWLESNFLKASSHFTSSSFSQIPIIP